MDKIKNYAIGILVLMIIILLGAIIGLKRTINRQEYAIANNCEWSWQGTMYGDDRDYVCK